MLTISPVILHTLSQRGLGLLRTGYFDRNTLKNTTGYKQVYASSIPIAELPLSVNCGEYI